MIRVTQKTLGMLCLMLGIGAVAFGQAVPEIDGASATSALTLLTGAVLVLRSRRK